MNYKNNKSRYINNEKHKNVMLNLFQHLKKSIGFETLKQIQGLKNRFVQQAVQ
jgi:hypothetical protein